MLILAFCDFRFQLALSRYMFVHCGWMRFPPCGITEQAKIALGFDETGLIGGIYGDMVTDRDHPNPCGD
jgi:hypothetical protein